MKILLVQSYLEEKVPPVYPLGLSYIATFLTGHEVRLFDPNVVSAPWRMLEKEMAEFAPDVVGVSLRNIDNQQRVKPFLYFKIFEETIRVIKRCSPDVIIVAGGAGFSMFAQKIMERNPLLNIGVYLEGEETFPELLGYLDEPEKVEGVYYRRDGKVFFTGNRELPDFEKFPLPRRDLVDIEKYLSQQETIGINTKRGCPLNCAYCNYPILNGNRIRVRAPIQVVDEIEKLLASGVDKFMFADGIFNRPLENAADICREIIKRGLKVKWSAWLDLRHATEEFLVLAIESGCVSVTFSPDAVSKTALKEMRKGYTTDEINNNLKMFIENKKLRKLNVSYHVFVNPPGETFQGFMQTILFYLKTKVLLKGRGGAFLGWIRIEPDTRVCEIALKEKLIDADTDLLPDNEADLKHLFYTKRNLRKFNFIPEYLLKMVELVKGAR